MWGINLLNKYCPRIIFNLEHFFPNVIMHTFKQHHQGMYFNSSSRSNFPQFQDEELPVEFLPAIQLFEVTDPLSKIAPKEEFLCKFTYCMYISFLS